MLIKQDDSKEKVVLVDKNNRYLGCMDKLQAHQQGVLHRAFSIFIFNDHNQLLIQKRASNKYHSPNEWANTCCGHPRENENIDDAARRRLWEEMRLTTPLNKSIELIYKTDLTNNLIEHELVQFFVGITTHHIPMPNPYEVSEYL